MLRTQLGILPQPHDRYDEVLSGASHVIARDGFESASIRVIAESVNLSQAGLYHYVSSKQDLLYQIQKQTFTALRNSLAARLDSTLPPVERLQILIRNHLEFFLSHMDELRVAAFESQRLKGKEFDEVLAIRRDYFRIAHHIVREVIDSSERPSTKRLNSKRVTLYLFGALNWTHMWFDVKRRIDVDLLVNEISQLVLNGIGNSERSND